MFNFNVYFKKWDCVSEEMGEKLCVWERAGCDFNSFVSITNKKQGPHRGNTQSNYGEGKLPGEPY